MSEAGGRASEVLHLRVEGRVQGVGFRRFVERTAIRLGLPGWARNLTDGSVEVLAAGAAAALGRLRAQLTVGPPHAVVARLIDLPNAGAVAWPRPFRVLPDAPSGAPLPDLDERRELGPLPSPSRAMPDSTLSDRLRAALRDVPDFPKPGVLFKDVTPVLRDGALFREVTATMAEPFRGAGVTRVAGIESRGFIFGAPIAQHLGVGFVPLRKPGKLPWNRQHVAYALEYGTDGLEAHVDACPGDRVVIVDDVLATGGTAGAACELVEAVGGTVVGCSVLLSLDFLGGAARLAGRPVRALLHL